MTKEELKEIIIDYVIDTYSLNKDRDVVANHLDEWLDCREQVNSVGLADVVGRSEQYHCELFDFGRCEKPCDKQCDSCYWMETKIK